MTTNIPLVNEFMSSDDLENQLKEVLSDTSGITIYTQKKSPNTKAAAIVVAAYVAGLFSVLVALINGMLKVHEKSVEREIAKSNSKVKIRSKNGREIEFPVDSTKEEIDFYISTLLKEVEKEGITFIGITKN